MPPPQNRQRPAARATPAQTLQPISPLEDFSLQLAAFVRQNYTPTRFAQGRLSLGEIHRHALQELSERFTSNRGVLPPGYLNQPKYRAAYLLYFVLTGVATVQHILQSVALPQVPSDQPLRVLDVGAGPLTASIALALTLPADAKLQIVAIDGATPMLEDGRALLRQLRPNADIRLITGNLRDARLFREFKAPFDVILVANVLNEWQQGGGRKMPVEQYVQQLLQTQLAENGVALLVEPATREASHQLIDVREAVVTEGELAILSPCMGQAPCPLSSASMRDWCHAEQPWQRPSLVRELDDAIGHRRSTLKYSHLVLARRPQPKTPRDRYRVIGGPMRAGGQFRRYLCGVDGKVVATTAEHDLGPFQILANLWRGDAVVLPGQTSLGHRGREAETMLQPQQTPPSNTPPRQRNPRT